MCIIYVAPGVCGSKKSPKCNSFFKCQSQRRGVIKTENFFNCILSCSYKFMGQMWMLQSSPHHYTISHATPTPHPLPLSPPPLSV